MDSGCSGCWVEFTRGQIESPWTRCTNGGLPVAPGGIRGVFRDALRTLGCDGNGIGLDPRVRWAGQTVLRVQDQKAHLLDGVRDGTFFFQTHVMALGDGP